LPGRRRWPGWPEAAPTRQHRSTAPSFRAALALLDLLRLAALWESGALARGRAETRAADERLLGAVVEAIREHQSGEKSVPVARVGKHLVRRIDLRLARVHERVAGVLGGLNGPIDDEVLDQLRAAFSAGGLKGVTREKLAAVIARLSKGAEPARWIRSRRGPDQAAADLMSAGAPRSGRYVFLVKQMLPEETDAPVALEDEARGRVVSPRELTEYLLGLLELVGHSPRAIRRVMDALYPPRTRPR
jgi:hypothetical protein